jgi:malate dehydrogenase (oxaloacetate-decarboxylating)(NADP+)
MREVRRRSTLIGALLVHFGEADGMICGTFGHYHLHLDYVEQIIGSNNNAQNFYAMNVLMMEDRNLFIADTYVNPEPSTATNCRNDFVGRRRNSPFWYCAQSCVVVAL